MRKSIISCMWLSLSLSVLLSGCQKKNSQPVSVPTEITATTTEKPADTNELDNVMITLTNQVLYQLPDIDFRFVIATLHVEAEGPTNIALSHFKTEEGIQLDQVQTYVHVLEEHSYFLGRQNVWFSLVSSKASYDVNIFIPVKEASIKSMKLNCDFLQDPIKLDLSDATGTAEQLSYQADDVITDGNTYQLTVSHAYDISGDYLYRKVGDIDTEYLLPSTTKVYAFAVEALSLWGDSIQIESAQYVTSSGEVFDALDSSIHSEKWSNMIARVINEKDTGYLFFYAFDPDDHPVTYNGVLKLKLTGDNNPIAINVNLN